MDIVSAILHGLKDFLVSSFPAPPRPRATTLVENMTGHSHNPERSADNDNKTTGGMVLCTVWLQ